MPGPPGVACGRPTNAGWVSGRYGPCGKWGQPSGAVSAARLRPLGSALLMPGSVASLEAAGKMRRLFRMLSLESSYRDTTTNECDACKKQRKRVSQTQSGLKNRAVRRDAVGRLTQYIHIRATGAASSKSRQKTSSQSSYSTASSAASKNGSASASPRDGALPHKKTRLLRRRHDLYRTATF